MWIFSKSGFYSIVEHRKIHDTMLVRSRTKGDLERMVATMETAKIVTKKAAKQLLDAIEEAPRADYRWRLNVPRKDIKAFLTYEVEDIHYTTSVKSALDQGDPKRHSAMLAVWTAMMRLQKTEMGFGRRWSGGGAYSDWDYAGRRTQDELDFDFDDEADDDEDIDESERLSIIDRGDDPEDDLDTDVFDLLWDLVNTSDAGEFESLVDRAKVILRLEDEVSG